MEVYDFFYKNILLELSKWSFNLSITKLYFKITIILEIQILF